MLYVLSNFVLFLWFWNNEAFIFTASSGSQQNFLFLEFFGSTFLVTYSQENFKLNYQMTQTIVYMYFTKGSFQKKRFLKGEKFLAHFDHITSLTKKRQWSKFDMKLFYKVNFKIPQLDLLNP